MKRSPFTEKEVSAMVLGTMKEVIRDRRYFYESSVGSDYCHLTEEGREALTKQMEMLSTHMFIAIKNDDIARSKQIVFDELKGK